jgi:hypothetical protein
MSHNVSDSERLYCAGIAKIGRPTMSQTGSWEKRDLRLQTTNVFLQAPHPNPLPDYGARGPEKGITTTND